ncbi:MAG: hypothetical protein ABH807_00850 [Candidatus Shapirobacteria bacterium]
MKKILILVDTIGKNKQDLVAILQKELGLQVEVVLKKFSDVTIEFIDKKLFIEVDDEKIQTFGVIYFRRVGKEYFSLAGNLAICLESLKIKYFDTFFGAFSQIGSSGDKFASLLKLALVGLPVMPSFFCWRDKIEKHRDLLINTYGLPLIAKELSRQRGEGVMLITTGKDFDKLKETAKGDQYLFQCYYPAREEYRFLVYGYRAVLFYRKIKGDPSEFRSNVAVGGGFEFLPLKKAPAGMGKAAVKVARTLKLEITGVDFLVDQTGKFWILEANRGPGFTYDSKLSPEVPELAKFFARSLGI